MSHIWATPLEVGRAYAVATVLTCMDIGVELLPINIPRVANQVTAALTPQGARDTGIMMWSTGELKDRINTATQGNPLCAEWSLPLSAITKRVLEYLADSSIG